MSIFDHVAPSERAAALELVVQRLRRRLDVDFVPMLVVEGRTDEPSLGAGCRYGNDQVFSAGTRQLVEGMVVHLDREPILDAPCAFLIDCDGRGKTGHLRDRAELVVTEACDLEADLVRIGVAARVIAPYLAGDEAASDLFDRALQPALAVSIIRRAAHAVRTSMQYEGGQLRYADLPPTALESWQQTTPEDREVVDVVGEKLGWDPAIRARVLAAASRVERDVWRTALGRDILDAAYLLSQAEASGQIRGWTRDHFHSKIRLGLQAEDFERWEVGKRLAIWAQGVGSGLLAVA